MHRSHMYTSNLPDPKIYLQRGYEWMSSSKFRGYLDMERPGVIRFLKPEEVFNRSLLIPLEEKEPEEEEEGIIPPPIETAEPKPDPEKLPKPAYVRAGHPKRPPFIQVIEVPATEATIAPVLHQPIVQPEDVMSIFKKEKTLPSGDTVDIYVPFQVPWDGADRPKIPSEAIYIRE